MLYLDFPTSLFSLPQTISDTRSGDRNPALSCTHIGDCWLRNEYLGRLIISQLEQITQWNAIYIISAVIWLHYLQSSVFISVSQTQMKLEPPPTSPSGVHQRGISISEYVLGKSWPHRAASNYLCLLGAWSYAYVVLFMLFFKTVL